MTETFEGYAYAGSILRVHLGNGRTRVEPTVTYAREWLGGPGIAVKLLYDELSPGSPRTIRPTNSSSAPGP